MPVVIRLARFGSIHKPKYRITVADSRFAAKKRFLEVIGHFNPAPKGKEERLVVDVARAKEWIHKGAQPSDRVKKLLASAEASG